MITPSSLRASTAYATQKPEGILRRIPSASSQEGDWVLDGFAGSGTSGAVAQQMGRRFVLIDDNDEAIAVMAGRLGTSGARYPEETLQPLDVEQLV